MALNVLGLQYNTSHLGTGNTTIGQIFQDNSTADAFTNRPLDIPANASVVTVPTTGADATSFTWTHAFGQGALNDFLPSTFFNTGTSLPNFALLQAEDLTLNFNENVDVATLISPNLTVMGSQSGEISYTVDASDPLNPIIFLQEFPFANEIVSFILSANIQDQAAQNLANPITYSFPYGPAPSDGRYAELAVGGTLLEETRASDIDWGDYDNDGDLDFVAVGVGTMDGLPRSVIFKNEGNNTFIDNGSGLTGLNNGSAEWGDIDGDDDLDLLITGQDEMLTIQTILYRNEGSDVFTEIVSGIQPVFSSAVDFGDYDNDGDLDLALTGNTSTGPPSPVAIIYQNAGLGSFSELGTGTGLYNGSGTWVDLDNDGDLDLETTGFDGTDRQVIFYNNDNGVFQEYTPGGIPAIDESSTSWGDYNQNGTIDLLLTGNTGSFIAEIYENDGDGTIFSSVGAGLPSVTQGRVEWGDYDGDADFDILLSGFDGGGEIADIWRNDGGSFTAIGSGIEGFSGAGVSWGDWDNDGDVDAIGGGSGETGFGTRAFINTIPNTLAPNTIAVTAVNDDVLAVKFQDPNENETEYVIERAVGAPAGFTQIGTVPAIERPMDFTDTRQYFGEFFDTGLTPGTTYYYRVASSDGIILSEYSDTASLTLQIPDFERIITGDVVNDLSTQSYSGYWSDYDNDNDQDLVVLNWAADNNTVGSRSPSYFYENNADGTFTKVSPGQIVLDSLQSRAGSWGDLDNDGDQDFVEWAGTGPTSPTVSPTVIYRNNAGTFSKEILVNPNDGFNSLALADFDKNGFLDIVSGGAIHYNQDGTNFVAVEVFGTPPTITGPNVTAMDFNDDGWTDIFLSGDGFSGIYQNVDGTTFQLIPGLFSELTNGGRGATLADYDNDGDIDVAISRGNEPIRFFENNGDFNFSLALTWTDTDANRGFTTADFDNDGDQDLIIVEPFTTGSMKEQVQNAARPTILFNDGGGGFAFTELDQAINSFTFSLFTSTASVADYDLDGYQDIFIANGFGNNNTNNLYRNKNTGNNWVKFDLNGSQPTGGSNADGIGAVITITAGAVTTQKQLTTVNGTWSGNEQLMHFGLGAAATVTSAEVKWPSGKVVNYSNLAANQTIILNEGFTLRDQDSLALVALYQATDGASWTNNANWLTGNIDTWNGVTAGVAPARVTGLDLGSNNLIGMLPPEFYDLTAMTILELDTNAITGVLPVEISNLSSLTMLNLNANQLSGSIPIELGDLTGLMDLQLGGNLFDGTIPTEIQNLNDLATLVLANNQLTGGVPSEFTALTSLTTLDISNNLLTVLPNISALTGLTPPGGDFDVSQNIFTFEDLEPNNAIIGTNLGQKPFGPAQQIGVQPGTNRTLSITEDAQVTTNTYQWEKDGQDLTDGGNIIGATTSSLSIANYSALRDNGIYKLKITNSTVTDSLDAGAMVGTPFQIESSSINLSPAVPAYTAPIDSLGLIALFNSTDGFNWSNNEGWRSGPVSTWAGVTTANGRVSAISLPSNNLDGTIPTEINNLVDLQTIDFSGNELDSIPAMNAQGFITSMNMTNNLLEFNSIVPNATVPGAIFSPQKPLLKLASELVEINESQLIDRTIKGTGNVYSWTKDNQPFAEGGTGPSFTLSNIQFSGEGSYVARVTNPGADNVELVTTPFLIRVSSIRRDSLALVAIYQETGGPNWNDTTNWLTGPLASWFGVGVDVANNRVTKLIMPANNMVDTMAIDLKDIGALDSVNLRNNELRGIPDMRDLPQLSYFDISGNRLGFEDLEINNSQSQFEFIFAPQRRYGVTTTKLVRAGTREVVSIDISGTNNTYQWFKKPRRTAEGFATPEEVPGEPIEGATERGYVIESIDSATMGIYYVEVTNPIVPGLTIRNRNQNRFAIADIGGRTFIDPVAGTLMNDGDVIVYEIEAPGQPWTPFDTVAIDPGTGTYFLPDVVLGDYIIRVRPGPTFINNVLQTYYKNPPAGTTVTLGTNDWVNADILKLRTVVAGVDIQMIFLPEPFDPAESDALIGGLLESDLQDPVDPEEGLRGQARRRVRRAGVSLNKLVTRRRTLQEQELVLVAYTETDDEGMFAFPNVPPGDYLLNIQFPGIPMDTTSLIQFTIDPLKENQEFDVAALVTELGISVELISETGFYLKYFKDLEIYPNPADHYLTINYEKLNSQDIEVYMTDLAGNRLLSREIEGGRQKQLDLDVTGLQNGIYILVFVDKADAMKPIVSYRVIVDR